MTKRRLAAILSADAVAYSRLMSENEEATVAALDASRRVFHDRVEAHGGRVVDTAGDSVLAVFESVVESLRAALEIQERLQRGGDGIPEGRRMRFRIGVNAGDLIERPDGSVYGDGVNVAARLQALGDPDGICVSEVCTEARNKIEAHFEFLGEQRVKNIHAPVRAYRLVPKDRAATATQVALALPAKPSIGVLPFVNMSGNPEQEYFADGITDCLITEVSRLPGLFVISRQSSFVYKGKSRRAEEIGAELGVKYLLEGGVQRAGGRVRITVQLIDAASGAHVWAERYDRELTDIFMVQDDVTRRIVEVLQAKLGGPHQKRRDERGNVNLEAQDSLFRGLERYWMFTPDNVEQARVHFARAVEVDPGYAAAHAWLARTLVFQWIMLWDTDAQILDRALEHARRAVDLDPQSALAHAMICWVQLWRRQGEAAIAAGRQAVALDPNSADAHLFLAFTFAAVGRGEEALQNIEKGMRLNPHPSAAYQCALGLSYFVLEDYDQAVAAFKRGIEVTDAFTLNRYWLCLMYTLLGRDEEAKSEREKVLASSGFRESQLQNIWMDDELTRRSRGLAERAGFAAAPTPSS